MKNLEHYISQIMNTRDLGMTGQMVAIFLVWWCLEYSGVWSETIHELAKAANVPFADYKDLYYLIEKRLIEIQIGGPVPCPDLPVDDDKNFLNLQWSITLI